MAKIEGNLLKQLEEILLLPRPTDSQPVSVEGALGGKGEGVTAGGREGEADKMHEAKLLKDAEVKLVKVYESALVAAERVEGVEEDEVNEEVVGILQETSGMGLERMDLSGRQLRFLPRVLASILGLIVTPNSLVE
ncbi:hypothetical protein L1049_014982 [Liquidambar formosana]|uniref:Uncharacterized protein n=1 Tax=Liquidambar formosana TaxID=63359 RepID=A0AAP0X5T3_LIQFO